MARIKTADMDPHYTQVRRDSLAFNETNDCTVVALTIVCNATYAEAHAALAKHGRKNREGAYRGTQLKAINELGYFVASVWRHKLKECVISQYPSPHNNLQTTTTHHPERFAKVWSKMPDNMMLYTKRHVSAYQGGVVKDWVKGKAKRIEEIWIVRKTQAEADAEKARLLGGKPEFEL
jgi:hypothetical protein